MTLVTKQETFNVTLSVPRDRSDHWSARQNSSRVLSKPLEFPLLFEVHHAAITNFICSFSVTRGEFGLRRRPTETGTGCSFH